MIITKEEIKNQDYIINEPERVILFGEVATDFLKDYIFFSDKTETDPAEKKLFELFELEEGFNMADDQVGARYPERMFTLKRKSDGKVFGFQHPVDPSGQYEDFDSNGDSNEVEVDTDNWTEEDWDEYPVPYVFLPVVPFTLTGYKFA